MVPIQVLPSRDERWLDGLADWYKQLISLASGFIAVTVTFSGNLIDRSEVATIVLMILAWVSFGVTVITALCGLRGVSIVRDPSEADQDRLKKAGSLKRNSGLVLAFVSGVWFTAAVGVASLVLDDLAG